LAISPQRNYLLCHFDPPKAEKKLSESTHLCHFDPPKAEKAFSESTHLCHFDPSKAERNAKVSPFCHFERSEKSATHSISRFTFISSHFHATVTLELRLKHFEESAQIGQIKLMEE
jgi:hypothetical protein